MGGIISCHFCLFVVLGYPSFLSLFCSCSFWDVLRMHHLVLLAFPASACFRPPPQQKKKDNSPTKPGAEKIWNIINLVAINVLIPCNNVWHGEGPHLVFGHKIDCPTAPSHPFAPILPTKPNLSNLVQTKLLQSSPICQPWTKPKCPTKFNLSKLKQNFPTKSNLPEHQLGLQDVRVLKHFILEDNTKVLEVIEHQTCTYLLVHSRINSTLIVRN